ncbi:helix-turn-helix domain-containing protein [Paraclostridium bifermentans]|uniref:helix-turn-helix domain-containing protein n=1 Tax=Paraclostridium bifermentans TaxID=1490 RepID=UPI00038CB16F|nr:MerR family transcriptional regulator [Paraclostridium bifermentans]EQK49589.1 merR regulatory family protein [[Clostridium] bifermentans ATCC 19299] [Paraclostridium bifermentans ATCC 19299]
MKNQILIGDFVKLTNSTLKTVLYYHKIGLLKEPKRSNSGYRLYGAEELNQMRMIKHLKNLGLDLKKIKEILGHAKDNKNITEVLKSLHCDLLTERKKIDEQISKIETLLNKQVEDVEETLFESSSFRAITEILNQDQFENYKKSHEELFNQQRNIFGVMDDFQWGKNYKENFSEMAKYFKLNPKKYEIALELGNRLSKLKYMEVDDPEIEKLAKEGAEFIKNEPVLKEMLYEKDGFEITNENLFDEVSNKFLSPAQIKHKKLIQEYLNYNCGDKK